jgi:hypothetical protein
VDFLLPHSTPRHAQHSTRNMEEDRAATNLGPEVDEGISEEPTVAPKQPRRRFVGRKTAGTTGEQQADPNANIEDSSAIQGVRHLFNFTRRRHANHQLSRPTSSYCSRAECTPRIATSRPRDQRCHRSTSTKLQLRDPQMHTPNTDFGSEINSATVP